MKVITIGRDSSNDVVIDDFTASRHHLQIIQHDDGHYTLSDFGSTNGTFVNGQQIVGEIFLDPSDIVRIGNTTIPWRMYFEQNQQDSFNGYNVVPPDMQQGGMVTLKVIRAKKLFGFAIKFSVFVDGKIIGELKNGVTLTCELNRGPHKLKVTSLEKDVIREINIGDGCQAVEVNVSLGMGILAGRPHIDNVKYF